MNVSTFLCLGSVAWYNVMSIYCIYKGSTQTTLEQATLVHGIVCMVNVFIYLAKYQHLGIFVISKREIHESRYIEWIICSPLMVLEIALCSKMSSSNITISIILTIAFCICGSLAAFVHATWIKILLGIKGSLYCTYVIYLLWMTVLRNASATNARITKDKELGVSILNLSMASIIWPLYIITWFLGPDVCNVISIVLENNIQSISSILLKTTAFSYALVKSFIVIDTLSDFLLEIFSCMY